MDWVNDLGVETSDAVLYGKSYAGYVWANVSHLSLFGVSGTAILSSGDGSFLRLIQPGEEVLLITNQIDQALSSEFLAYMAENNISANVVNASEFTSELRVDSRLIIILGGPDAYEGVGEIVKELLNEDEERLVRTNGSQNIFIKYNVWTNKWSFDQKVIILAGSDRYGTQASGLVYREDVKTGILN